MFPSADVLQTAREALASCVPAGSCAGMADQIRALEELRGLLSAAQAGVTASFVAARRAEQVAAGWPKRRVGVGIAQEIGLAKRESPFRGGRYAGWATILTSELAHTYAALRAGETSEWRAMIVARETGWLSREHRATVDADLGPRLGLLGDREVEVEACRRAYALDPHGLVRRIKRAAGGRHVSLRAAPEGMTRLSAVLPLTQGVAVLSALTAAAAKARAAGDERSKGQVMADTLVERVTGQSRADLVPIMVNLIMTDQAFTHHGPRAQEPATVPGWGPIPAPTAREWITRAAANSEPSASADHVSDTTTTGEPPRADAAAHTVTPDTEPTSGAGVVDAALAGAVVGEAASVWLRRLFTDPVGRVVTMESKARRFTPAQAAFIRLRDQWCTTAFCAAAIRHIDHTIPAADGGPTSLTNGQGKCESCNQAKEAPGWTVTPQPDGTTTITTPTGHDATTFGKVPAPGESSKEAEPPGGPPRARPRGRTRRRRGNARAPAPAG